MVAEEAARYGTFLGVLAPKLPWRCLLGIWVIDACCPLLRGCCSRGLDELLLTTYLVCPFSHDAGRCRSSSWPSDDGTCQRRRCSFVAVVDDYQIYHAAPKRECSCAPASKPLLETASLGRLHNAPRPSLYSVSSRLIHGRLAGELHGGCPQPRRRLFDVTRNDQDNARGMQTIGRRLPSALSDGCRIA